MRKKIWQIILCFVFVVLFAVSSLPLTAFAATVDAKLVEFSDVYTDLKTMGIDPTKYPKDITAKHVRMLHFIEWGYDYKGDQRDYGLYVYVYNPSGKEIDLSPNKNYVQIQTYNDFTIPNGWRKMELEKCSISLREGYEHVFYKFKVKDSGKLLEGLQKSMRIYEISSVELRFKDSSYDLDSEVAIRYTYTGYMENHGPIGSSKRTLHHEVLDTFVLELDLQPATWKTKTSDKGAGYQYELFSTYFAVPNDVIKDYGDEKNATKGLIAVDGEYEEYKVNGLVTPTKAYYDAIYPQLKKRVNAVTFGLSGGYPTLISSTQTGSYGYYLGGFSFNMKTYNNTLLEGSNTSPFPCLETVLHREYATMKDIHPTHYLAELKKIEEEYGYPTGLPLGWNTVSGNTSRYGKYSYTVEAGNDLAGQIANYATAHQSGLKAWLSGECSLFKDSKNDLYSGINSIQVCDWNVLNALQTDQAIAREFFVQESEVTAFKSYVSSHQSNETVFKINYAVRDYYACPVYLTIDGSRKEYDGSYYYEKTIFRNFDVMTLTWQDQYGKQTVMPVAAKPIDVVGTPSGPNLGGNVIDSSNGGNNNSPSGCQILNYRPIVIVVVFLIACILINLVLSIFDLNIGKVLKWIWSLVTWPFRQLWKLLKKKVKDSEKKRKANLKKEKGALKKKKKKGTSDGSAGASSSGSAPVVVQLMFPNQSNESEKKK